MAPMRGTPVAAGLVTFDTADKYATHYEELGQGGFRSVQTDAALRAIPTQRQKPGMWVNVRDTKTIWELQEDFTWKQMFVGSSNPDPGSDGSVSVLINGQALPKEVSQLNFTAGNAKAVELPDGKLQINLEREFKDARAFHFQDTLDITVARASGSFADVVIYNPSSETMNCLIHGLQIMLATLGGGSYSYEVWSGNPATTGRRMFDSLLFSDTIDEPEYHCPVPITVLSNQGNNVIYVRVYQRGTSPLLLNMRVACTEFAASMDELPGYKPPPPYTGPLLMDVYVGGDGQFTEPRYALPALHPNGTMHVAAGTYYLPFGMGNPMSTLGVTNANQPSAGKFEGAKIIGADAYKTIFNGRGGYGRDPKHKYSLFWRKGVAYFQFPVHCEKVSFIGGGGADLESDGEAGTYLEGFHQRGKALFRHCAWDWNENGLFVPDNASGAPGENVEVRFEECDFGLRRSNGQSGDGRDHNFYINGPLLEVIDCHGYGTVPSETYSGYDAGNTYKARAQYVLIQGGYCEAGSGRWLDRPKGGETLVKDVLLSQRPGANGNAFGYANEVGPTDPLAQGAFDTHFEDCPIYISRYQTTIWNQRPGTTVYFTNCPVTFCLWPGSGTPPDINIQGPGDVVGLGQVKPDPNAVFPEPPTRPGSIAQPGYVPSWP